MNETFVNPYTFVPFPQAGPHRCAPQGHAGRGDLLSGTLVVTLHARTPLLLRGISSAQQPTDLPRRPDGTPMIPGSALKGALRSLHETLAGGCLRVFDEEFTPSYRDSASAREVGSPRMAVVAEHHDERTPPVLRLCTDEARKPRLHQEELARIHREEGPLTSGDRLRVDFDEQTGKPHRAHRDDNGEWVVLLSDTNARRADQPYYAHIRKLPADAKQQQLAPEVWERFRTAVAGTDDLRTARLRHRDEQQPFTEVTFSHKPHGQREAGEFTLGRRDLAAQVLRPGQPVWVHTDGDGTITKLQLGMIWRHPGETPTGERIDKQLLPCDDDQELCPSCRLFGSADTTGEDTPEAQQRSYRGHVRVGDATAVDEVTPHTPTLPPLGAPQPGAGQFYLHNDAKVRGNAANPPLREWGSAADNGQRPRTLRGRKHYWHTPTSEGAPPERGRARNHQHSSEMATEAAAFPAGTRFTARLAFTDLDEAQLGGLLACLLPGELLDRQLWQHVGGGRPLGYGSCTFEVDTAASEIQHSGARYGAAHEPIAPKPERFLEAFRDWARTHAPAARELWPQVAKALDPHTVDPDAVWYPPGAYWQQREHDPENFDKGYAFWERTSGKAMRTDGNVRTGHPLIALPELSEPEQRLPILPETNTGNDNKGVELPNQARHPGDGRKGQR
ncbi:TIGR03986 family type III CRISPR-associated RAMP protein [Actinopolyspora halophila]|uniref:TIGR03986 family type III CRISPR-associated RAMP protein n=1 Tax=Actinopolyspora halophila TaxID=1850 RepID=UPI000381B145|nr:TIGR03986 family CRISPR-associated RAMP protein [Actinopolyspora halophila]